MQDLIKAIQNSPTDSMAHWDLGEFYEKNATLMNAIAQYRTSITFGNGTPYSFLILARTYFSIGQIKLGVDICEQLIEGEFDPTITANAEDLLKLSIGLTNSSLKSLNHNSYYRLKSLADHINETTSNKHCSILDVGGGIGELCLFLPDAYYALVEPSVNGLSAPLPFEKKSFDIVVSCHVLEHIPINERDEFLDSLCMIAKEKVIILNPFSFDDSNEWLTLIYEITGGSWAKEHAECTMPVLDDINSYAKRRGYPYKIIPNGSKTLSISMLFFEHYAKMTDKRNELIKINNMFNNLELSNLVNEKSPNAYLIEFDVR
ncbi:class I SAM-dependent methyltransferase [Paenibacillus dokdonensis]|uniref:class I SAM-dependent methyltransferase n=1 Tax=Paenibacillus dokdonensis TaxID=2567944 RepID=UPI0010A7FCA0|nr:class I SAM-dependent methyltransferase [Paenibacillus dokdonensis]